MSALKDRDLDAAYDNQGKNLEPYPFNCQCATEAWNLEPISYLKKMRWRSDRKDAGPEIVAYCHRVSSVDIPFFLALEAPAQSHRQITVMWSLGWYFRDPIRMALVYMVYSLWARNLSPSGRRVLIPVSPVSNF